MPMSYPVLADSLVMSDVAVFQAVKAIVVSAGVHTTKANAPVIAGRPGLLRVYVTPGSSFTPKAIEAELHLSLAGSELAVLKDSKMITGPSTDKDLGTTFNFKLSEEQIALDVDFSFVARDPSVPADRSEGTIKYPPDGTADTLDAQGSANVKVVIVPVRYDFDGSGRLPDTTPTQVARYHDTIYKMYPAASVDVSVHAPWPWAGEIRDDGTGWDEILQGLVDLRASDNPSKDSYYIAAFEPAPSIQDYCNGGCILGVAPLIGSGDVQYRVAMIVGYSGQSAPNTLNQELAHAMGREHAPCGGAGGPDKKYPYAGGKIGVWGYDLLSGKLLDPAGQSRDFMGYCYPIWISDYTFSGLYNRIRVVNLTKKIQPPAGKTLRRLFVGKDGTTRWGGTVSSEMGPTDSDPTVTFLDKGRAVSRTSARWLPYDNIPGGILLVPDDVTSTHIRIDGLAGRTLHVAR
jgi:hypothetical protein